MKLPKESIEEFRDIYEAEYGKRLSFEDAEKKAVAMLDFGIFIIETSKRIEERGRKRGVHGHTGPMGRSDVF